jgi:hypothetical protein
MIVTAKVNPQSASPPVTEGNALGYSFSKEPAAAAGRKKRIKNREERIKNKERGRGKIKGACCAVQQTP